MEKSYITEKRLYYGNVAVEKFWEMDYIAGGRKKVTANFRKRGRPRGATPRPEADWLAVFFVARPGIPPSPHTERAHGKIGEIGSEEINARGPHSVVEYQVGFFLNNVGPYALTPENSILAIGYLSLTVIEKIMDQWRGGSEALVVV